jgi:hypothetical protein
VASGWQKWLDGSVDQLRKLLANELRDGAAPEDVDKARKLLKTIAMVIETGDAAAWRRLAVAFDVVDVGGTFVDGEPTREGSIDSTMPAAQFAPASHSVDETVALGEFRALEIDDTDVDAARGPAGSTLIAGKAPPTGTRPTVPLPVHMPAGVTATGAPSHPDSMTGGGTTPMSPVPSSVLDVEKYAVLCAWTETHPERREQLHTQYGLQDEEERKRLDASFEALFAENLPLRSAFKKRLEMHLGFLRRSGG